MTVKNVGYDDVPKARRNRRSPIKATADWAEAMDFIRSGNFNVLKVEFSPQTLQLGAAVPDRFKRLLAAEIKVLGLESKIRLISRRKSASGGPTLYVVREQGIELPKLG